MIEQPTTFIDKAFSTSANLLGLASDSLTKPARNLYDSFNREGGSLDVMKRRMFSRLLKMRTSYKRPLQYA